MTTSTSSKRRRTSGPAAQSTLSFRSSKGTPKASVKPTNTTSKETKPTAIAPSATDLSLSDVSDEDKAHSDTSSDDETSTLEARALALPQTKIRAYWASKEKERKAPRVHQTGMNMAEKVLREWDLSSRYGPSVGIARKARWMRAYGLGLQPPVEVLAVLLKDEDVSQKSVVDDLLVSSRFGKEGVEA